MARESNTEKKLYASMADMPDSPLVIGVKGVLTETNHYGYCEYPDKVTKKDTLFEGYLTLPKGLDYKRDLASFTTRTGVVNLDYYDWRTDKLQLKRVENNNRDYYCCRITDEGTTVSFSKIKIMKKIDDTIF